MTLQVYFGLILLPFYVSLSVVCMHTCLHVWGAQGVYRCVHACGRLGLIAGVFGFSLAYSLRQGLSTGSRRRLALLVSWLHGFLCFCLSSTGMTGMPSCPVSTYMGLGILTAVLPLSRQVLYGAISVVRRFTCKRNVTVKQTGERSSSSSHTAPLAGEVEGPSCLCSFGA